VTPGEIEDRLFQGIPRRTPGDEGLVRRMGQILRLNPDARVLDVAAGTAASAPFLARHFGCRVLAVERDAGALDRISFAARQARVEDRVELVQAEEMELDLEARIFDAAICEGGVARLGGPLSFLKRFGPHVKVGGGLAFTVLCRLRDDAQVDGVPDLRRPADVLLDLVRAGCEPLCADTMADATLAAWREDLGRNAEAVLAHTAPPVLLGAAAAALRTVASLRAAGPSVVAALFVGRKLDDADHSPYFTRARGGS
jgi:SAM-dependent methyltransferase